MSSENLSMADVLKYSIRIENESRLFYEDSITKVTDENVKVLVTELRDEEIKHENRLVNIYVENKDVEVLDIDSEKFKNLINNQEIPPTATSKEVLEIALGRENNTKDFYRQVSLLTNIDQEVIDIFQMLYEQESGHVTRIEKLIEKI